MGLDACLFIGMKTNIYRCYFASLNIDLRVYSFSVTINICAHVFIYLTCLVSLCIFRLNSLLKKKTPPYLWPYQWHGSLKVHTVSPALCHTSQSVNVANLKGHLWKKLIGLLIARLFNDALQVRCLWYFE